MDDVEEITPARALITAGWDDVPHLSEERKAHLLQSTPQHMRDARARGVPSLGAGAIYPIPRSEIEYQPMAIPPHWKRAYAMDVGWRRTAGLWLAQDPTDQVYYAYAEYYGKQQLPIIHATAIKARGEWIKGCIDPASRGRSQADGKRLSTQYKQAGLNLSLANNDVEAGIYKVWSLLSTGQLKISSMLASFWSEYLLYRRVVKTNDIGVEKSQIVKQDDHLMDCLRYVVMMFDAIATVRPAAAHQTNSGSPADSTVGY
jgi:hypothetical protein